MDGTRSAATCRLWAALIGLVLLAHVPASADTLLSPASLASKGIDMQLFSLVTFSHDGSVLVGVEKVKDLQLKRQGIGSQLRIFRWKGGQLARVDTIPLPTTAFEQLALSPDGSRALVIGEGGSKFILVDVAGGRTNVIWTHKRGSPGFRSELVALWHGAHIYLLGYLHDGADQQTFDGLVRLEPGRSGSDMFQRALDVRPILRQLKALCFSMYIDASQAFFGVMPQPGQVDIYAYGGGLLRKIDQVVAVGGIASAENRIMYAARFAGNKRDVVLRDVALNKTWHLGRDNLPFNYLFLSSNGKTAIVTLMDFRGQTMSYFFATEADGFKTHPIPKLQDVRPGTLRLAGGGRAYAFYGPIGLLYGQLP